MPDDQALPTNRVVNGEPARCFITPVPVGNDATEWARPAAHRTGQQACAERIRMKDLAVRTDRVEPRYERTKVARERRFKREAACYPHLVDRLTALPELIDRVYGDTRRTRWTPGR